MGWFSDRVVDWQRVHGRHDLPWQRTDDPYRIWISEIMLQQTQVAAVIPFYLRFIDRFPDVRALAAASPDDVMRLWSGLGYYGRARNLHACAHRIVEQLDGEFPRSAEALAELPGIGRSTGAAIAAFAFGERVAILDGNVKRVLCRFEGIEGFPGLGAIERRLWEVAQRELPAAGIQEYTQGLMDLGATHCSRRKPACDRCPLVERCVARAQGRVDDLPTPRPRRALPVRETAMLVLRSADEVLLERRAPTGVWGGLWSLPEVQGRSPDSVDAALLSRFGVSGHSRSELPAFEHGFTHFRLRVRPVLVEVDARGAGEVAGLVWLPLAEIDDAALPRPVKSLLQRVRDASRRSGPSSA
jgi:A/G-specific adenine glycosylase